MIAPDETWLLGPDAEPYLAEAAAARDADELSLVTRLRKTLSPERARLVVEQAVLRRRARAKFTHAEQMFFTAVGLEQATDEVTATYKATRFAAGATVIDACCGIGGDLLTLARRGPTNGVDRDPVTAARAAANCRIMQSLVGSEFRARVEAAAVEPRHVAECDAWHIDPDRRPGGRRTTHIELHEPSLDVLDAMRSVNPHAAVKLAPAAELPEAWREAEAEWISRRGECKQLVAWFGRLAQTPGLRRATIIDDAGRATTLAGPGDAPPPDASQFGKFLFEPDAAVLAADLTGELAQQYQIAAVHPGSVYLTGDVSHDCPLLTTFEILDALPFDKKRLRGRLAECNVGRLEIKQRGVEVDVEQLRRELQPRGDAALSLILVRRGDRVTAVLARRVVATVPPNFS
jgi:hypothetical protein